MPPRPPVTADVADLRERVSRIEMTVDSVHEILKEHIVERKQTSIRGEIDRKEAATVVHDELKSAAEKTNASLEAITIRLAAVEQDLRDFRVGWKVLAAASAVMASLAGLAGAFAAKWFTWRI